MKLGKPRFNIGANPQLSKSLKLISAGQLGISAQSLMRIATDATIVSPALAQINSQMDIASTGKAIIPVSVDIASLLNISSSCAASSTPYLLDEYPNAAAAYSIRALSSAFTPGNGVGVVEIRNAGDNTTDTFEIDSTTGALSLSSRNITDTTDLATFIGSNDGFIVTWYDQSGNSYDATQSTASAQPKIISSGSLITENGKVAIQGATNARLQAAFTLTNPASIFSIATKSVVANNQMIYDGYNDNFFNYYGSSGMIALSSSGTMTYLSSFTDQKLFYHQLVSGDSEVYVDASLEDSDTSTGSRSGNGITLFDINGAGSPIASGFNWLGTIQEVIIYASNKSSDRSDIETNINDFFSIY